MRACKPRCPENCRRQSFQSSALPLWADGQLVFERHFVAVSSLLPSPALSKVRILLLFPLTMDSSCFLEMSHNPLSYQDAGFLNNVQLKEPMSSPVKRLSQAIARLATKADKLSLIPGTYIVEGEDSQKLLAWQVCTK